MLQSSITRPDLTSSSTEERDEEEKNKQHQSL